MCLLAAHISWTHQFFNETILLGDFCGLHIYCWEGRSSWRCRRRSLCRALF